MSTSATYLKDVYSRIDAEKTLYCCVFVCNQVSTPNGAVMLHVD